MGSNSSLTKFFVASALFFIWVMVQGAVQAQEPVSAFLREGPARMIVGGHAHVGTLGWISLALMGALYYLVPQASGKALSWPWIVNWVFWLGTIAIALNNLLLIMAGIAGGSAFLAGARGPQLGAVIGPFMMPIGLISIVVSLVAVVFAIQIVHTAAKRPAA